jgi:hypothetical protein
MEAIKAGPNSSMSLILPNRFKRPKGFPRGELLCETPTGNVYSFDPDKIIKWLDRAEAFGVTV